MDTITDADLTAITALAQVAPRLPRLTGVRIEHGTAELHVHRVEDAVAAAYLLGLTDRTVTQHDYRDPAGKVYLSTRTTWTLPGQPFVVFTLALVLVSEAA